MYIFGYKTSFYPKFVHFSEFFGKNFIFRVKITNILFFQDQMYILGTNYTFYPKFVPYSEIFWQKLYF